MGRHRNNAGTADAMLLVSINTDIDRDLETNEMWEEPGLIYEWETDSIDGGTANDFPSHIYVKYLNVFVCGQSETAETLAGGMPWI